MFKIKPIKNKANGQYTFSIPKKQLPQEIKDMLKEGKTPKFGLKWFK